MVPSYQTVPLAIVPKANAPKDERASTPVPRRKQVAVAAMMIGMALLVVGYWYGSNTHPARIDIATTTTMAANLVRGGVRNGDNSLAATDGWPHLPPYRCCKKISDGCEIVSSRENPYIPTCRAKKGYDDECLTGFFFAPDCCTEKDEGTSWFLGGCA